MKIIWWSSKNCAKFLDKILTEVLSVFIESICTSAIFFSYLSHSLLSFFSTLSYYAAAMFRFAQFLSRSLCLPLFFFSHLLCSYSPTSLLIRRLHLQSTPRATKSFVLPPFPSSVFHLRRNLVNRSFRLTFVAIVSLEIFRHSAIWLIYVARCVG